MADEQDRRRRMLAYFAIMGTCLVLVLLGFFVLRSVPVRLGVLAVAAVLPPLAAITGNRR